jgi:hypothetical protein
VLGSGDPEKQALAYADITNPQSLNKYQYSFNNPLRYVDPDGQAPQDSFDNRINHLIRQQLKGEISEEEYWASLRGAGYGALAGAALVGGVALTAHAPQIAQAILLWAGRNPEKVQQIAQDLAQSSTGSPAGSPTLGTPLSKIFNASDEVIASGRYVEGRLGDALIGGQFTKSGDKLTAGIIGAYANKSPVGVLHSLLNSVKDFARGQGVSTVELQAIAVVNTDLQKALIKQGFQKTTVLVDGEQVEAFVKTIKVQ